MERYDPRLSEYAGRAWLRESAARLPVSDMEAGWDVAGFAGYHVDTAGGVHRSAFTDASGKRRKAKQIKRACMSGCFGFWLRRRGVSVWVGIAAMRGLLRRA